MTEHLCVVCPQLRSGEPNIWEYPQVCAACRLRLPALLGDIADQWANLDTTKGRAAAVRVSGSRTPPLPLRIDPLDLALPARVKAVSDPFQDQTGYPSVASRLDSWAQDWQTYPWGQGMLPNPTVPRLVRWLQDRLEQACDRHPAIDEFATEMREMLAILRRVNGLAGPAVELLDVPCRRCDWVTLAPVPLQDRVECLHCGDLATGDEYERWAGLLAAGVRDLVVEFNLEALLYVDEAALLARVTQNTVRLWVKRALLAVAERDHGRPRFRAGDVLTVEQRTRSGSVLAA